MTATLNIITGKELGTAQDGNGLKNDNSASGGRVGNYNKVCFVIELEMTQNFHIFSRKLSRNTNWNAIFLSFRNSFIRKFVKMIFFTPKKSLIEN